MTCGVCFLHFSSFFFDKLIGTSGGLSQDSAGSGQNRVTAKSQVRAGSSHSAVRNITIINMYFVICIGLIQSYLKL